MHNTFWKEIASDFRQPQQHTQVSSTPEEVSAAYRCSALSLFTALGFLQNHSDLVQTKKKQGV